MQSSLHGLRREALPVTETDVLAQGLFDGLAQLLHFFWSRIALRIDFADCEEDKILEMAREQPLHP